MKNYYDVLPSSGTVVTGRFIKVPKTIATGRNRDGTEVKAANFGYPQLPANGSWQLDLRSVTPIGLDGPQWVLEYWSDINNVFQFVRVEGDDNPVKTAAEIHQPDNIETTMTGLLLIEDPGSSQQFTAAEQLSNLRATTARLWHVPFAGARLKSWHGWIRGPMAGPPMSMAAPPRTGAPGSRRELSMRQRPS